MLPPSAKWSEHREDGERQPGRGTAGSTAGEQHQPYPPRYRLSSLVSDGASSYVFLGFSQSGSFVWSYGPGNSSRTGEDSAWFYFQVWLWRDELPLILVVSEPFYRWRPDDDDLDDSEHPEVMLVESDDDSCVVVYGCRQPRRGDEFIQYHFAILPLPALPLPPSTTSAALSAGARVTVASHRFTCDCQHDDRQIMPVWLRTIVAEPTAHCVGRHLLLVQTSTAVNCLRFDVLNGSSSTAPSAHDTNSSSSSTNATSDPTDNVRSLLHFRSNQRVLSSRSWTHEQHRAATDDSKVRRRVVVRDESSLDIESLIASVDEFDTDFRLRDYYIRNLNLVDRQLHSSHSPRTFAQVLTTAHTVSRAVSWVRVCVCVFACVCGLFGCDRRWIWHSSTCWAFNRTRTTEWQCCSSFYSLSTSQHVRHTQHTRSRCITLAIHCPASPPLCHSRVVRLQFASVCGYWIGARRS